MSESPLQLSIKWIKLLADGKERIAAGDYVGALPVLEGALAAIEAVDAFSNAECPDIRVAGDAGADCLCLSAAGFARKGRASVSTRDGDSKHSHIGSAFENVDLSESCEVVERYGQSGRGKRC